MSSICMHAIAIVVFIIHKRGSCSGKGNMVAVLRLLRRIKRMYLIHHRLRNSIVFCESVSFITISCTSCDLVVWLRLIKVNIKLLIKLTDCCNSQSQRGISKRQVIIKIPNVSLKTCQKPTKSTASGRNIKSITTN